MGKVRVGLFVPVAVLVLAGCVARVGGAPDHAPVTDIPLTSDAFGYENTWDRVDPCSLTGPAAFEPYGTVRMPGRPDMVECQVSVATDDGRVVVRLGRLLTPDLMPADRTEVTDLGRDTHVVRLGDTCDAALVLADGMAVAVTAAPVVDSAQPSQEVLCGLTLGAAEGIFNVLAGERVKHWTPAANSLASLTPCEVLPRTFVAQQLGIPAAEPTLATDGDWCRWGREDGVSATLSYPVAESLAHLGVPAGTPAELIADRESWVVASDAGCSVYVEHIEFEPFPDTFEHAALHVSVPGDDCVVARTLAGNAWEHLPPT